MQIIKFSAPGDFHIVMVAAAKINFLSHKKIYYTKVSENILTVTIHSGDVMDFYRLGVATGEEYYELTRKDKIK